MFLFKEIFYLPYEKVFIEQVQKKNVQLCMYIGSGKLFYRVMGFFNPKCIFKAVKFSFNSWMQYPIYSETKF